MTENEREQQKQEVLKLLGSAGAAAVAMPPSTILPFQNLIQDTTKIKQKEAQRMFPGADPSIFSSRGRGTSTIPSTQNQANRIIFNQSYINSQSPFTESNIYKGIQSFPEYLSAQPKAPSPELGSYQKVIANKNAFPEESIQALTVTPGPNPGRFAKDYAEILADKLGKTINEREFSLANAIPATIEELKALGVSDEDIKIQQELKDPYKLYSKIEGLSKKIPGTAGYVWGNIDRPQYSYAEGNWGLGQKEKGANPSLYVSRINADPSKEADYLFTSSILTSEGIDPRVKFKHYPDLGPATGPSYGVAPNEDISFRKDLITARGELTTGDLQALLAERNLPFAYQTAKTELVKRGDKNVPRTYIDKKPGDILRENLELLAKAENITAPQAIERFARLVPNVGEPGTPPTPAVTGTRGSFPIEGQMISPFGSFASKTDLRQIGILPPSDKAGYTAFKVNGLIINRDKLRSQAANKLLNKTVTNLIEQSKPIQGLGLGGLATGAIATAMDPAVIDALARGDYAQAGTTAAVNTAVGSAVGGATAKGLQALRSAGYARPAAMVGSVLPAAGGVLAGLGAIETGKALNRVYRGQTGKDWVTRNQPAIPYSTYTGPTPTIEPRIGTAILGGKPVRVPYGSVAGEKKVGRPWWDKAGSQFENLLNSFSPIIGR